MSSFKIKLNPRLKSDNYAKGLKKLNAMGSSTIEAINKLSEISPDLAHYAVEFTCGNIYSRPGLDAKSREIVAVAALTVLGNALPQLKLHTEAALLAGCSKEELIEVLIQTAIYAGFPAVFNAISAVDEVFKKFQG